MKYTIHQLSKNAKLILRGMGDSAKFVSETEDSRGELWTKLEITISSALDIQHLINCGIHIGIEEVN